VTNTATASTTATPSLTASQTPTTPAVSVQVSQGTNPPANSTQLAGATNVTVLQIVMGNPGGTAVNMTSLTLTDSGTGSATDGISSVTLTKNGTSLSTGSFTSSTTTLTLNDTLPANGSVTYLIAINFSATAPLGTYTLGLTGAVGSNGTGVNFSGLPLTEATVTVVEATSTPTNTITQTFTNTPVNTSTPTATNSFTPTDTLTATFTHTMTATMTWTVSFTTTPTVTNTFTPKPTSTQTDTPTATATYTATVPAQPIVSAPYPNPSNGAPIAVSIQVPAPATVTMDVFTLSFRKVASETVSVESAKTLLWDTKDILGIPVANGLYYVRIHIAGIQSTTTIVKVLVLR
jgi:hypothetical protein